MKIFSLAFLLLFQFLFGCNQASEFPQASQLPDNQQNQKRDKTGAANIVFKSTDGGQTWQDISDGLPVSLKDDSSGGRDVFFADDNGLWFTDGNGIYHSKPNFTAPFWNKEIFPNEHSSIAPGKAGIFAYNYHGGGIFQKTNGTGVWSPVFTNFPAKRVFSVSETAGGTIFIGSDKGLFKSTNSGKSWKQLYAPTGGKIVESNAVLLASCQRGILRSTDDGESWALVISEGGVGIDIERIEGGFATINYSAVAKTRRIRTTYDGGKTWQAIDAGRRLMLIFRRRAFPIQSGALRILPTFRCQNTRQPLSRLVKTSFVVILTAFTGHQTREKHGNWYILPQKGRCSYYLFPAT